MNLSKLDLSNPIIRKDITKKIAQECFWQDLFVGFGQAFTHPF